MPLLLPFYSFDEPPLLEPSELSDPLSAPLVPALLPLLLPELAAASGAHLHFVSLADVGNARTGEALVMGRTWDGLSSTAAGKAARLRPTRRKPHFIRRF
ncbi:hypothetical protein T8T21_18470 (plasmid) [Limimaricola variabilis]|uniref:hypothetical protein n=1 Tax=Limimaricola variabilis TaxID=1492771 RepID=UPI002AC96BB5|nr:hypothetical protein [Limimaricola variabilis]WPY96486.1 hypothetical protein T8T21_18470 [Limimaricola variabilis]